MLVTCVHSRYFREWNVSPNAQGCLQYPVHLGSQYLGRLPAAQNSQFFSWIRFYILRNFLYTFEFFLNLEYILDQSWTGFETSNNFLMSLVWELKRACSFSYLHNIEKSSFLAKIFVTESNISCQLFDFGAKHFSWAATGLIFTLCWTREKFMI